QVVESITYLNSQSCSTISTDSTSSFAVILPESTPRSTRSGGKTTPKPTTTGTKRSRSTKATEPHPTETSVTGVIAVEDEDEMPIQQLRQRAHEGKERDAKKQKATKNGTEKKKKGMKEQEEKEILDMTTPSPKKLKSKKTTESIP